MYSTVIFGGVWVLVLACNCVQPTQTLYATRDDCMKAGEQELRILEAGNPRMSPSPIRCMEVPR